MFKSAAIKDLEEKIYEKVAAEIQAGEIEQGLWARALAESKGDKKKTESKYIQLRVDKLKEKSIKHHKQEQYEKISKKNDDEALENLRTIPLNNAHRFKFLAIFLLLAGFVSTFIALHPVIGMYEFPDVQFFLLFTGIILIPLSVFSFFESLKIEKSSDINILYKKTKRLFWVMIPTCLTLSLFGAVSVIIGLVAFIVLVKMIIEAFKFGHAYKRAIKRGLI